VDSVEGLVDVEVVEAAVVVEGATAVDVMSDPAVVVAVVVVASPRLPGTEAVVEVEAALEVAVVDSVVDTAVVPEVVVVAVPVGGRHIESALMAVAGMDIIRWTVLLVISFGSDHGSACKKTPQNTHILPPRLFSPFAFRLDSIARSLASLSLSSPEDTFTRTGHLVE